MTRDSYMVGLVFLVFFVMSLLTNILGPLVPDIITGFHVSLAAAAFLPFSFFIAYGVMSIPAGFWVERFTEKPVMIAAFVAGTTGSLIFALHPTYSAAVASLFVMGAGMATLQTAINPLLRVAGGEEHFAFNSAFAQLIFGTASFVSPRIYSYLVQNLSTRPPDSNLLLRTLAKVTPPAFPWASMYWIFAVFTIVMIAVLVVTRFPKVRRTEEEAAGSVAIYRSLLKRPIVWMFFFSVFAYVGCEQGTADWISKFLSQYHGYDPHIAGAAAVSWFWGLLTAGCFIGMLLLKIFDSRHVLIGTAIGALLCLTVALFGPPNIAVLAFPAIGLFASVMWPILVSLGLNSVSEHHGPFAGILSTGIMGGAVIPVIIGRIGDHYGLRAGMAFLYVTFGCVLSVGFWAKPIITNATISFKKAVVQPVL
ncbi:MAG: MFS transporter [Acidobacteria bacterium]|nr:MAG: MFS transporter [Acidobacteriota bacterium]PYV67224.1 MAG: MFS transporter [Acidobacteriota bacterium]PYV74529.1 MAG: MFS transporter [Acidobacteriota bacterium]